MMNDQLRQLSHSLRLFGVHGNFEKRAEQAAAQSLNHLEFLRFILEDEINQRKNMTPSFRKDVASEFKVREREKITKWEAEVSTRGSLEKLLPQRS